MAAFTTDYTYCRGTTREARLQSSAASVPVYTYIFDWRTPIRDGLLQSPHTLEVPFSFGTAPVAASLVSTGSHLAPLTEMMVATWSAFAHREDPSDTLLPRESNIIGDPDGERRNALDGLPLFEYSMPVDYQNT